jgi:hypothetical protein
MSTSHLHIVHNKCKEHLPTKLQFKVDKNPMWPRITSVVSILEHGLLAGFEEEEEEEELQDHWSQRE